MIPKYKDGQSRYRDGRSRSGQVRRDYESKCEHDSDVTIALDDCTCHATRDALSWPTQAVAGSVDVRHHHIGEARAFVDSSFNLLARHSKDRPAEQASES